MTEALAADYVRTAHAKGLTENVVLLRHAFRNALDPVHDVDFRMVCLAACWCIFHRNHF